MSEFDDLYREVILDHYKNPHNYGVLDEADARAEGQNPLCGDEVTMTVKFAADGETIEDVGFEGRGCAISQAATSMLTDLVKGKKAADVASLPKEEILDEVGIPLTPVRMKCAILGLGVGVVRLEQTVVVRVLVMVEDHLAVQVVELGHQLISSRALRTPAASRSISSSIV